MEKFAKVKVCYFIELNISSKSTRWNFESSEGSYRRASYLSNLRLFLFKLRFILIIKISHVH